MKEQTLEQTVMDVLKSYWQFGGDTRMPRILRMGEGAYREFFRAQSEQMRALMPGIIPLSPDGFILHTDFGAVTVRKCFTFAEPWMWELGFEHTL